MLPAKLVLQKSPTRKDSYASSLSQFHRLKGSVKHLDALKFFQTQLRWVEGADYSKPYINLC